LTNANRNRALALDSNYFDKEKGFYKKILKKNERFEAISNFIDGKIDNKLEYDKENMCGKVEEIYKASLGY